MTVLIICTVCVIFILSVLCITKQEKNQEIYDSEISNLIANLGNNETLAKSILKFLGNEHTKVEKNRDEKATVSFYTCSSDKIIIKHTKNNKELSRFVHVAHECVHSTQSRKLLWAHFILSNIQSLYFLGSFIFFFYTEDTTLKFYLLLIQLFIFLLTFLIKVILESDASYRAISVASDYIEVRTNHIVASKFKNLLKNKLYQIMPTFYFTLFMQGAILLLICQIGALFS